MLMSKCIIVADIIRAFQGRCRATNYRSNSDEIIQGCVQHVESKVFVDISVLLYCCIADLICNR